MRGWLEVDASWDAGLKVLELRGSLLMQDSGFKSVNGIWPWGTNRAYSDALVPTSIDYVVAHHVSSHPDQRHYRFYVTFQNNAVVDSAEPRIAFYIDIEGTARKTGDIGSPNPKMNANIPSSDELCGTKGDRLIECIIDTNGVEFSFPAIC